MDFRSDHAFVYGVYQLFEDTQNPNLSALNSMEIANMVFEDLTNEKECENLITNTSEMQNIYKIDPMKSIIKIPFTSENHEIFPITIDNKKYLKNN